jgi:hypothetical protein
MVKNNISKDRYFHGLLRRKEDELHVFDILNRNLIDRLYGEVGDGIIKDTVDELIYEIRDIVETNPELDPTSIFEQIMVFGPNDGAVYPWIEFLGNKYQEFIKGEYYGENGDVLRDSIFRVIRLFYIMYLRGLTFVPQTITYNRVLQRSRKISLNNELLSVSLHKKSIIVLEDNNIPEDIVYTVLEFLLPRELTKIAYMLSYNRTLVN